MCCNPSSHAPVRRVHRGVHGGLTGRAREHVLQSELTCTATVLAALAEPQPRRISTRKKEKFSASGHRSPPQPLATQNTARQPAMQPAPHIASHRASTARSSSTACPCASSGAARMKLGDAPPVSSRGGVHGGGSMGRPAGLVSGGNSCPRRGQQQRRRSPRARLSRRRRCPRPGATSSWLSRSWPSCPSSTFCACRTPHPSRRRRRPRSPPPRRRWTWPPPRHRCQPR